MRSSKMTIAFVALVACARASHVQLPESPLPRPPVVAATSAALSFSPWDGVYLPKRRDGTFTWVRTRAEGISMWGGVDAEFKANTRTRDGGWILQILGSEDTLTLVPPLGGGAWRMTRQSIDETPPDDQRVEPLEARVRARLAVGDRFVRWDRRRLARAAHDVITILERGRARTELLDGPKGEPCIIDAMGPALLENRDPRPMPLPDEGSLGVVYWKLYRTAAECPEPYPDPDHLGEDGEMRMFADREGRVVGIVLAYAPGEVFVAPNVTQTDVDAMTQHKR